MIFVLYSYTAEPSISEIGNKIHGYVCGARGVVGRSLGMIHYLKKSQCNINLLSLKVNRRLAE